MQIKKMNESDNMCCSHIHSEKQIKRTVSIINIIKLLKLGMLSVKQFYFPKMAKEMTCHIMCSDRRMHD